MHLSSTKTANTWATLGERLLDRLPRDIAWRRKGKLACNTRLRIELEPKRLLDIKNPVTRIPKALLHPHVLWKGFLTRAFLLRKITTASTSPVG